MTTSVLGGAPINAMDRTPAKEKSGAIAPQLRSGRQRPSIPWRPPRCRLGAQPVGRAGLPGGRRRSTGRDPFARPRGWRPAAFALGARSSRSWVIRVPRFRGGAHGRRRAAARPEVGEPASPWWVLDEAASERGVGGGSGGRGSPVSGVSIRTAPAPSVRGVELDRSTNDVARATWPSLVRFAPRARPAAEKGREREAETTGRVGAPWCTRQRACRCQPHLPRPNVVKAAPRDV